MAEPDPLIVQARAWRLRRGWSQARLSVESGMHQASISGLESGANSPTLVQFRRYLCGLGLGLQIVVLPTEQR